MAGRNVEQQTYDENVLETKRNEKMGLQKINEKISEKKETMKVYRIEGKRRMDIEILKYRQKYKQKNKT